MGFIEVYRGILRYETGIYPTIPSFIASYISFVFGGIGTDGRRLSVICGEMTSYREWKHYNK